MSDPRPWTHAALLGALWGAAELTVGTAISLTRLPIVGLVMGLVGLVCLVTLRRLQPRPGVCLIAGFVAVFLKVFTMGGFVVGPLAGILGEAMLVELAFTATGSRAVGAPLGGAATMVANVVQMVAMIYLVSGREAVEAIFDVVVVGARAAGLEGVSAGRVAVVVVAAAAAFGGAGGAGAWMVAGRVLRRVGRR